MIKSLSVVILAAGQGKRMNSALPKVLHPIGGRAMLSVVIATAQQLNPTILCVVYGHGGEAVREAINDPTVSWALQAPQYGTGHAVLQALPQLPDDGVVLVLYGDVPLISKASLDPLIAASSNGHVAWLTQIVTDPHGLGRIVRNAAGQAIAIVRGNSLNFINTRS